MMEVDLVARLVAVPALAAIQGDNVGWFERAGSFGYPATVLQEISPGREYTHEGPDELDNPRIQFDFYGIDPVVLLALSKATLAEMEVPADVGTTRFHPAMLDSRRSDLPEETADGRRVFRITMDLNFYHEQI